VTNKPEVCDVGEIPFWRGAQSTPELQCDPFAFERDETGLIRQKITDAANQAINSYAQDDYHFQTSPPGSSEWGNKLAELSLQGVKTLCGDISGLDALEVGGGTLYNAKFMIEQMHARSVTLVDPAVRDDSPSEQIHIHRDYLTEDTDLGRTFDVIISLNALEHVIDPGSFLRAIRKHLSDDGLVFLKMPECENSFGQGDLGLCVHEHISYFTPDSLDKLLLRSGLERAAEANYMGALQIAARKTDAVPDLNCTTTTDLLTRFQVTSQANIEFLKTFAKQHSGERVAFIGASAGLANALHLSNVAAEMEVEVYDSDALKVDLYLPGIKAPILHTGDERLELHKWIFVAPINFFDDIVDGLRARPNLRAASILPVFSATR
jgi:2-polyprenyl-3-methyl-5-hydroxy-6-metoxy-1,4-benzoquinol methylase